MSVEITIMLLHTLFEEEKIQKICLETLKSFVPSN